MPVCQNIFAFRKIFFEYILVVIYARACYNMVMKLKKTTGLLLALFLSAGVATTLSAPISAYSAQAEGEPLSISEENAELLLPTSYEQYLPLDNPAYIAMNDEYIAVADRFSMYVYDRGAAEYSVYHHIVGDVAAEVAISKMQFTDEGELFFRDNLSNLYRYDFETGDSEIVDNMSCLTFLIQGKYMYMANESSTTKKVNFTYVPVDDMRLGAVKPLTNTELDASNPRMAYENDTLYCVTDNNTVYAYDGKTHEYRGRSELDRTMEQITNLQFVCAYGNEFYYTVNGTGNPKNGLYRTDKNGNAECIQKGDNFSTITSCGGKLYCIQGSCIRELAVNGNQVEFTGYEIAADSSSPHRLAGAGETVRTKNLVAACDKGNTRVSVYNRIDGTYTVIPCEADGTPFVPEHVAIDKEEQTIKKNGDIITTNRIAVSNGSNVYVYTLSQHSLNAQENGVTLTAVKDAKLSVADLCFVYGECYYVTEHNGYGCVGGTAEGELHFSNATSPTAIASDLYGTIYVAFTNRVLTFHESDFLSENAEGEELLTISGDANAAFVDLTVDYEGNVWYLTSDGKLFCNATQRAQIDGKDFVYLNEEHDYPVSFALSFEDDEVYFNFKNYVVKTNAYALSSLPTLNKIVAGEAKQKAFDLAKCDSLYVQIPNGTVGVRIDLGALKTTESEYFPYESYFRSESETPRRGVLLYEPESDSGCYIVALYDEARHSFTANLFKKSRCEITADEDYYTEEEDTAYITNDVSLCSAPCLFPAPYGERLSPLADTLLKRGDKLQVLGYAEGEDRVYAFVENEEGVQGFVPRSYLSKNNPLGTPTKDYKLGYLKGDAGVVLKSESGEEFAITEKTAVRLYANEDGTYTAILEKDGVTYSGIVASEAVFRGEANAMRISLIVILSVLALVIVACYAFLMFPKHKKKK